MERGPRSGPADASSRRIGTALYILFLLPIGFAWLKTVSMLDPWLRAQGHDRITQGLFGVLSYLVIFLSLLFYVVLFLALAVAVNFCARRFFGWEAQPTGRPYGGRSRYAGGVASDIPPDGMEVRDRGAPGVLMFFSAAGLLATGVCSWLYLQAVQRPTWNAFGWAMICLLILLGLGGLGLYRYRNAPWVHVMPPKPPQPASPRTVFILMLIVACVLWAIAGVLVARKSRFLAGSSLAAGTVVWHSAQAKDPGDRGGHDDVFLEVRYRAADGKERVENCRWGNGFDLFLPREGDQVRVAYDPSAPADMEVDDPVVLWEDPVILSLLGLLLVLAGAWRYFKWNDKGAAR